MKIAAKPEAFIKARITKGFSQRELARHSGVSHAYISLLERRKKNVGPFTAKKLSELLDKEIEELFEIYIA
ncbi:XRE family transcriptional regulator [Paenibacillus whitsoniae]|uniref:XRE family transcriptional regulator n=1 Tax=Paenibacillus whitsoniae TaxID=2496558 RepID=A0A430J5W9_9BACL|nr:XRE family transcriptional regulator [Paenibacillus whitsoniae]